MISLLLLLFLADPGGRPPRDTEECKHGGSGAQCVTCVPSDRGTIVCRGICYHKDASNPRPDGGYRSEPLKTEDKDATVARKKLDQQAKEACR